MLILVEICFELFLGIFFSFIGKTNDLIFLVLGKILFLILLFILNFELTKQKIPFSFKLKREQRQIISILIIITFIAGFLHIKNFFVALTIGLVACTTEEYLMRGIVLVTLLRLFANFDNRFARILPPVIISSILFGMEHFLNLASQNLSFTIVQVCIAITMGFVFASIFLRTGNLLYPMICHFEIDFLLTLLHGAPHDINVSFQSSIPVMLFYLFIGLIILIPVLENDKN